MNKLIKRLSKRAYVKWLTFNRKMNNPQENQISETQKNVWQLQEH